MLTNTGFSILPSWHHLRAKQKEITPDVQKLPEPFVGVSFSLFESVLLTVQRLLHNFGDNLTNDLWLNIKFGFDGSGSHSIFNQQKNEQTNNIIMTMFCPLKMKTEAGSSAQKWDFPDGTGKGGTTTTGNTARVLLYKEINRDFIVSKLKDDERCDAHVLSNLLRHVE